MTARPVVNPDARSPYRDRPTEGKDGRTQQYGKTPYRYSPAYYAWRRQHVSKQSEAERQHAHKEERKRDERKSN